MRLTQLVPLVLAAAAVSADEYGATPVFVQLGGTYLSQDLRAALGSDWGVHAGIGTLLGDSGVMGMPSADLDLRYASSHSSTFTAFATSYAERRKIGDQWWLGFGIGGEYLRVKRAPRQDAGAATTTDVEESHKWVVSGKGMLGLLITQRFFLEGTYHYSPKVLGVETTSMSIGLGYWF